MTNIEITFDDGESLDLSFYKLEKSRDDALFFVWANIIPYTSEYKHNIVVYKNKIKYIYYNEDK